MNNNLQKAFFTDYMLGNVPLPKNNILFAKIKSMVDTLKNKITLNIKEGFKINDPILKITNPDKYMSFSRINSELGTAYLMHKFKELNGKNYAYTKYCFELIKKTEPKISTDYLMHEFCGFISFPEDMQSIGEGKVNGLLFNIQKIKDKENYQLCYAATGHNFSAVSAFELAKNTDISLYLDDKNIDYTSDVEVTEEAKKAYKKFVSILFASILFVIHNKDIIEEMNEFATKKSKLEKQRQLYTPMPYYTLDLPEKVKKKMNYNVTHALVKGHGRLQPYGPKDAKKRSIKLIYIAPTVRVYNKNEIN